MNDAELKALQRAISTRTGDVSECPDSDTLIAFADGELEDVQRELTAMHVAQCDPCVAVVRVAIQARAWSQEVAAELEAASASVPDNRLALHVVTSPYSNSAATQQVARLNAAKSQQKASRAWWPVAIAATLASVVVASLSLRQPLVEDGLRGDEPISTSPMADSNLTAAPERFSWPCAAAPTAASVELLGADALPRWSGSAHDCAASVPVDVRQDLGAGEYLWRVKNAAGESVLGPMAFRITP